MGFPGLAVFVHAEHLLSMDENRNFVVLPGWRQSSFAISSSTLSHFVCDLTGAISVPSLPDVVPYQVKVYRPGCIGKDNFSGTAARPSATSSSRWIPAPACCPDARAVWHLALRGRTGLLSQVLEGRTNDEPLQDRSNVVVAPETRKP